MRVFSCFVNLSNENETCTRVDKICQASVFIREFCQLSCPGQTRTRQSCIVRGTEQSHQLSYIDSKHNKDKNI